MANSKNITTGGQLGQSSNPPANLGYAHNVTPNVTVHPHAVQKIVEQAPVDTGSSVSYGGEISEEQQQ